MRKRERAAADAISVRSDPKGSGEVSVSGDGTCKAGPRAFDPQCAEITCAASHTRGAAFSLVMRLRRAMGYSDPQEIDRRCDRSLRQADVEVVPPETASRVTSSPMQRDMRSTEQAAGREGCRSSTDQSVTISAPLRLSRPRWLWRPKIAVADAPAHSWACNGRRRFLPPTRHYFSRG